MQPLHDPLVEENLGTSASPSATLDDVLEEQRSTTVAIIDGMAELQSLKLKEANTCSDLAYQFCKKIFAKYRKFSEIHVVFDTYVENSLKAAERLCRQKVITPVQYKITSNTNIKSITLQKLLSHVKTKDALTELLSKSLLSSATKCNISLVVAYRNIAESNNIGVSDLQKSSQATYLVG